jgi:hypothetical protein
MLATFVEFASRIRVGFSGHRWASIYRIVAIFRKCFSQNVLNHYRQHQLGKVCGGLVLVMASLGDSAL